MNLAELQAKAAALQPMRLGAVHVLQGRSIYLDGDGLAYYCAGNDETSLGEARVRLNDKVRNMQAACGAEKAVILLTASGSHKGYRYAVARSKPYQGQRRNSRRPKNWQGLRDMLMDGVFGDDIDVTTTAEADDRFGFFGHADPERTVIATQDKDMRMVPGWHINWTDNQVRWVAPGTYDVVYDDLQYGTKWFWCQMLHGDNADHIPGLTRILIKGKHVACGEAKVPMVLGACTNDLEAYHAVAAAYKGCYGVGWAVEMLEQAVLLWMRKDEGARWDCCLQPGCPMYWLTQDRDGAKAIKEITQRVTTAQELNDAAETV